MTAPYSEDMDAPLAHRVALVTGGGTGIGRAIALRLADEGANVAVNYSRSREDAEATAGAIRERRRGGIAVQADVSRDHEVRAMIDRVVREWGRLDILVNNAGTTAFVDQRDLDGLTEEVWDRIFDLNVKGTFYCIRAGAKVMTEGRIINIGSVAGVSGAGSSIAYAASKGAIHTMTKSLARALAPKITVNTIAPGLIDTRWHAGREAENAGRAKRFPVGRIGNPADIAHIATALATSDNFLTGQIIVVDGGALL
ncbi:MAG TPA: SDR family oxidoreductase [bacterium]|nr:SDR family oxidoreductase [bacterium]